MSDWIKKGDLVRVRYSGMATLSFRAYVLNVGPAWVFQDEDSGEVHEVSEGCTVTLLKPTVE